MKNIAVIGAGLAGLSASIRLAHAGFTVSVFEQRGNAGGKVNTKELDGFRFDTGPSLFTMPEVFAQLFEEAGESIKDHIIPLPLEIICRYFYEDGTKIRAFQDVNRFGREIQENTKDNCSQIIQYLKYCNTIYDLAGDLFLWHSLHEPATFLNKKIVNRIIKFRKIDAFRTMHNANASFFNDPRTIQLFDRYATYNGSNPYRTPATLNLIQHVEYNTGGYTVQDGIYAIPAALKKCAEKRNVQFHFNEKVYRIIAEQRKIKGIETGNGFYPADIVISNVDAIHTYETLLEDIMAPLYRRYLKLEPSSSALVFYWGINCTFPELGVNNIFFSGNYAKEFSEIFNRQKCPEDPTVYINITSKVVSSDAPCGCENWFILVNTPYHTDQNWEQEAQECKKKIIPKLNRMLGCKIEKLIVTEDILTPLIIKEQTGSSRGSLYGISSNTPLAAFLRHKNRSQRYNSLYFCGGSVHPGGGMPLAILSGKITSDLIKKYET